MTPTQSVKRAEVVELVPELVFAIGGVLPLDERISWAPKGASGYQPAGTYLVLADEMPLVIDPGLAWVEDEVVRGLSSLVPAGTTIDVFLTRSQLECVGNLGAVAARYPIRRIYTGGVRNPFDAFDASPSIDQRSAGVAVQRSPEDVHLEIIHASLRLLNTYWAYDARTKVLFTSDAFTHTTVGSPDAHPVLDDQAADTTTSGQVIAFMLPAFPWLEGAVTAPIAQHLRAIFDEHDVETVAPVRGCVLQGRDVVMRHVDLLAEALITVGKEDVR
jgi:hypothetical protein